ncbi:hypothetical protein HERIO_2195 [Hepatospora eriocheir]|uniref:Uncharacterized protein n=1 Tax=Hepatospora eriocheir TaxID=1081669 RepID=A0A1X0Q7S4_9MICR|nr:hypothetical protein HERIO_2195 [Hepatospora eriocheir]
MVLDAALFCYRVSPKAQYKMSLFELVYGRASPIFLREDEFIRENYLFENKECYLKECFSLKLITVKLLIKSFTHRN